MGMFLRRGAVSTGPKLGDLDVGTLVKLNENGSPVEFYVAKHDYESTLNGSGRTLVVRKDCYDERVFSGSNNAYASSSLDAFLTGTYFNLLDASVREKAGTTKFYYTPGFGNDTVTTLERAVFQLSLTELGQTARYANTEGTALPIASTLQIAHRNGAAVEQWTRSPRKNASTVCFLYYDGYIGAEYYNTYKGSRPAFTLPATIKVGDGNLITG